MKQPEFSPLYGPQFSPVERHSIQAHNQGVILSAFSKFDFYKPTTRIDLPDLIVNGASETDASLVIDNMDRTFITSGISYKGSWVCTRTMRWFSENPGVGFSRHHTLGASYINTREGFEGNGFGLGIFIGSDKFIVPQWVSTLPIEPRLVLSYHMAESSGVEEELASNGYRSGWTGDLLKKLGYRNDHPFLSKYLGDNKLDQMASPESCWLKVLRK